MNEFSLSQAAQHYAWRELARRAGLPPRPGAQTGFEPLGLPVYYAPPPDTPAGSPGIYIVPTSPAGWGELTASPAPSLDWLPVRSILPPGVPSPLVEDLPVLFWGESRQGRPFAEILPGIGLVFNADLLAAAVFMLSRWEEQVIAERDSHGRFPGCISVAYRQGFLDRPVIDEYGLALQAWLQALIPGWKPAARAFAVRLTHDIDYLKDPLSSLAWNLLVDLKHLDGPMAAHTLSAVWKASGYRPMKEGLRRLVELSRQYGMKSTFFFMAARPSKMEEGYRLDSPPIRAELQRVQDAGFEIGLHTSYATLDDPARLRVEKELLDRNLRSPSTGARQHYLRISIPETWRLWEQAGFVYDSSLYYSDQEGFRGGTCLPYPVFDLENDRPMLLEERPLIIMEGTLLQYKHLAPDAAYQRILQLAQRCQRVGGHFTFLWHNSALWREFRHLAKIYPRLLQVLKTLEMEGNPPE